MQRAKESLSSTRGARDTSVFLSPTGSSRTLPMGRGGQHPQKYCLPTSPYSCLGSVGPLSQNPLSKPPSDVMRQWDGCGTVLSKQPVLPIPNEKTPP